MRNTLADRPELAGPARGKLAAGKNRQALAATGRIGRRPGNLSRTVVALIIDQDHIEGTPIILAQERTERCRHHVSLVARRNDGHNRWPAASQCRGRRFIGFPLAPAPEAAMGR